MTEEKSSAQVLAKIWQDFASAAERATGLPVRKSATSRHYLDGDDRLLTRWMNPGAHKNWRIPLSRVPDVCRELKATPQLKDELMLARFSELAEDDPQHQVLVSALWAFEECERNDHGLSPDERRVLATYREQASRYPRGLYGAAVEQAQMGQMFETLLKQSQQDQEEEANEGELDNPAEQNVRRKAKAISEALRLTAIATTDTKRRSARTSNKSLALQVRDYLKGLQRKRP